MGQSNMSGFQRVMAAIKRLHPDRVPRGELVVDRGFINDFMRIFGGDCAASLFTEMEIEFYRRLGLDLICIPAGDFKPGEDHFANYIRRLREEGFFIFSLVDGAFQTVMKQAGFMEFCVGVASQPELVGRQIQDCSQKLPPLFELAVQSGAHGVIIADDLAYNQGTYVSPDFIEKYLLPCWREQVNAVKKLGAPVFFHSDGNIGAVLPQIAEAGFEGLQCIEPAAGMDIKKVRDVYGKNFCLMGNIDPVLLIQDNGPFPVVHEDLDRAVEELVSAFGTEGGLIFGTSCGLYAGLSPEKVVYMYELAGKAR